MGTGGVGGGRLGGRYVPKADVKRIGDLAKRGKERMNEARDSIFVINRSLKEDVATFKPEDKARLDKNIESLFGELNHVAVTLNNMGAMKAMSRVYDNHDRLLHAWNAHHRAYQTMAAHAARGRGEAIPAPLDDVKKYITSIHALEAATARITRDFGIITGQTYKTLARWSQKA